MASILHLDADDDGETHFEEVSFEFERSNLVPPASPDGFAALGLALVLTFPLMGR